MSPRVISQAAIAEREAELIQLARSLVEKECMTTLTIDKLVAASSYSKGTIYKHFIAKEDLLLAICNTCMTELHGLFERAKDFDGSSREKILAVMVSYLIWGKLHPAQLFVVLSAHSPSVTACSSESRNTDHIECESTLMATMIEIINQGIQSGDFVLPENMDFIQVTFALWSSAWGAMALIMSKGDSKKLEPLVLERESFANTQLILDGFNWSPLSKNWDYRKSIKRITAEIFQTEIFLLEKQNTPLIFP